MCPRRCKGRGQRRSSPRKQYEIATARRTQRATFLRTAYSSGNNSALHPSPLLSFSFIWRNSCTVHVPMIFLGENRSRTAHSTRYTTSRVVDGGSKRLLLMLITKKPLTFVSLFIYAYIESNVYM
jgi:hypothetical protein